MAIVVVGCLMGCSHQLAVPEDSRKADADGPSKPEMQSTTVWERVVLTFTNRIICTAMAFDHSSAPPWERGNHLSIRFLKPGRTNGMEVWANWTVVNIHCENFDEITRRLKARDVELQVAHVELSPIVIERADGRHDAFEDRGYAVVTDPRIAREWFLQEPRGAGADARLGKAAQAEFPEHFRHGGSM